MILGTRYMSLNIQTGFQTVRPMVILFGQYFAIYNNENSPHSDKVTKPLKIAKTLCSTRGNLRVYTKKNLTEIIQHYT